jgi:hypothetical protein
MDTFKLKYRKRFFWKTLVLCGMEYIPQMDRLSCKFEDGSSKEIAKWSKYDCELDTAHFYILKKQMESQRGESIPTNEVRK